MSRRWVANASPLILLGKADLADLLTSLCDELIIPEAVMREVASKPDGRKTIDRLRAEPGVRFAEDRAVRTSIERWDLGPGESQVLELAADLTGARAVLDDREARRCGAALTVPAIGTLGVILRAKRLDLIPAARPVLEDVRRAGLYVSPELVEQALEHLGESVEDG